MKRVAFIPAFFTLLAIVFAVAVWARLRAYDATATVSTTSIARNDTSHGLTRGSAPPEVANDGSASFMVPADPETGLAVTGSSSNGGRPLSAREQRYQELLRSSPPVATAPAAEPPSFLERVVAPIASALGVNKPKPVAAAAAAPQQVQPRVQPQAQQPRAVPENPRTSPPETPEQNQPDQDPNTDTQPPTLLSATFDPPQVQDGETTTFAAMVNDNLSGVRTVSGVITSPSGSMQGFSCTREGETNRFIARVTVPAEAPEGVWSVKYLTLTDNASNTTNLSQSQGLLPPSATFRVVSSSSDASGPQLKSVWLEKQAMRAGERNVVFVQAEDDKAGVSLVSGVFVSPAKAARIGFGCRAGANGVWECPLTPPGCLDCGVWRLEQIQLQDKANNLATFRADNQVVGQVVVDISGDRCDSAPPTVTMLALDPTVVSNAQATIITVQATMVDEGGCGVASLSGQAVPPGGVGGQRRYVSFVPSADGQTFVGKLEIPQFAAKGQWSIAWIQALDKGHNLRAYSASDPVVARATFRVE